MIATFRFTIIYNYLAPAFNSNYHHHRHYLCFHCGITSRLHAPNVFSPIQNPETMFTTRAFNKLPLRQNLQLLHRRAPRQSQFHSTLPHPERTLTWHIPVLAVGVAVGSFVFAFTAPKSRMDGPVKPTSETRKARYAALRVYFTVLDPSETILPGFMATAIVEDLTSEN